MSSAWCESAELPIINWVPAKALKKRVARRGRLEILIRWQDLDRSCDTWEPASSLKPWKKKLGPFATLPVNPPDMDSTDPSIDADIEISEKENAEYSIEKILFYWKLKPANAGYVFLKWGGYPMSASTWEPIANLMNQEASADEIAEAKNRSRKYLKHLSEPPRRLSEDTGLPVGRGDRRELPSRSRASTGLSSMKRSRRCLVSDDEEDDDNAPPTGDTSIAQHSESSKPSNKRPRYTVTLKEVLGPLLSPDDFGTLALLRALGKAITQMKKKPPNTDANWSRTYIDLLHDRIAYLTEYVERYQKRQRIDNPVTNLHQTLAHQKQAIQPSRPQAQPPIQPRAVQPLNQLRAVQPPIQPQAVQPPIPPQAVQSPIQPQAAQPPIQPQPIQAPIQPQAVLPPIQPQAVQPPIQPQAVQPAIQPQTVQPPIQPQPIQAPIQPQAVLPPIQPHAVQPPIQPQAVQPAIQPQTVQPPIQRQAVKPPIQPQPVQLLSQPPSRPSAYHLQPINPFGAQEHLLLLLENCRRAAATRTAALSQAKHFENNLATSKITTPERETIDTTNNPAMGQRLKARKLLESSIVLYPQSRLKCGMSMLETPIWTELRIWSARLGMQICFPKKSPSGYLRCYCDKIHKEVDVNRWASVLSYAPPTILDELKSTGLLCTICSQPDHAVCAAVFSTGSEWNPRERSLEKFVRSYVCYPCRLILADPFRGVERIFDLSINTGPPIPNSIDQNATFTQRTTLEFNIKADLLDRAQRSGTNKASVNVPLSFQVRSFKLTSDTYRETAFPHSVTLWVNTPVGSKPPSAEYRIKAPPAHRKRKEEPWTIPVNSLKAGLNKIEMECTFTPAMAKYYYLAAVVMVHETKAEKILAAVTSGPGFPSELSEKLLYNQIQEAQKTAGADTDVEISNVDIDTVKLTCPSTLMRMEIPGRGFNCSHTQCFDVKFFILSQAKVASHRHRWKCPICDKYCLPHEIIIDTYMKNILAQEGESASKVYLKCMPDGTLSWTVTETDTPNYYDELEDFKQGSEETTNSQQDPLASSKFEVPLTNSFTGPNDAAVIELD